MTKKQKKEVNMKSKIVKMMMALFTIAFLVGCASVPKVSVKETPKT